MNPFTYLSMEINNKHAKKLLATYYRYINSYRMAAEEQLNPVDTLKVKAVSDFNHYQRFTKSLTRIEILFVHTLILSISYNLFDYVTHLGNLATRRNKFLVVLRVIYSGMPAHGIRISSLGPENEYYQAKKNGLLCPAAALRHVVS